MHGAAQTSPNKRAFAILAIAAITMTLGACATVDVSSFTSTHVAAKPPAAIVVEVVNRLPADDARAKVADKVAFYLQTALLNRLTRAALLVEPLVPGRTLPGAAVLRVSIREADPGSLLERYVVGLGAGRAELLARADFERPDGPTKISMIAFNTSTGTGFKPGILLPGAITLVTRNVVLLAIHVAVSGGVLIATNIRGGLEQPIRVTAAVIVSQLEKYYATEGWVWPGRT